MWHTKYVNYKKGFGVIPPPPKPNTRFRRAPGTCPGDGSYHFEHYLDGQDPDTEEMIEVVW